MGRYLSNGTMGDIWTNAWCYRCVHEHQNHDADAAYEDTCPVFMRLIIDDHPIPELTKHEHEHRGWGACCLSCSAFSPCECDVPEAVAARALG